MKQHLLNSITQSVELALEEDIGDGDITARLIDKEQKAKARILSRESAVICGIPWVNKTFNMVDNSIKIEWQIIEGDRIKADQTLCTIHGNARHILTAERTALNFLQTLSATATTAQSYAQLIADTKCKVLDTRKTIPGLRLAQKYAVNIGGGEKPQGRPV